MVVAFPTDTSNDRYMGSRKRPVQGTRPPLIKSLEKLWKGTLNQGRGALSEEEAFDILRMEGSSLYSIYTAWTMHFNIHLA